METSAGQSTPEQAKEKVRGASDQAQDKAREATGQAQEKAHGLTEQARSRVNTLVDQRTSDAGDQVRVTADALRKTASQLREQGQEAPANGLDAVSERIEDVARWLRSTDGEALLREVEDFGRKRPSAIIFGGLALGFVASRFLGASSTKRRQSSSDQGYGDRAPGYGTRAGELPRAGTTGAGAGVGAGADVGGLSGSPTSGLTAEGDTTSAPTSRTGLGHREVPGAGGGGV